MLAFNRLSSVEHRAEETKIEIARRFKVTSELLGGFDL